MANETKRISPTILQQDKDALAALKKMDDYAPPNKDFTLTKVQGALDGMESAQETETQKFAEAASATDDKTLSIMATRKYRAYVTANGQADAWAGQLNLYFQADGTTMLNGLGVLSDSQKVAAVADFKNKLGGFPIKEQLMVKVLGELDTMPSNLNKSVAWDAEVSGSISYQLIDMTPFSLDLGAGFTGMYQQGNLGSITTSLSATAQWDVIPQVLSIDVGYEYKDQLGTYPIPPSSIIKANNVIRLELRYRF